MPSLAYDPARGERFLEAVRSLPGYPAGESVPLRSMAFESDALLRLPTYLRHAQCDPGHPLLIVQDRTSMRRAGEDLKPKVDSLLRSAGWATELLHIEAEPSGQVHTTMAQIETVAGRLGGGRSVLALGSGTVTDIAKHACYLREQAGQGHVPFVVFQTANSVSAYTSNMAPVFVNGVKRTLPSRYPDALVCDLETLRDAPAAMTVAGVGDLLAAFVRLADWCLAFTFGFDSGFSELPQRLLGPLDELLLEHAEGIRRGDLESVSILAKLIALAGFAMSLSHSTAPLSGLEHVMSHVLDLQAESQGRPLAPHGTQVALATILVAGAYQDFLGAFRPDTLRMEACFPEISQMRNLVTETFLTIDPSGTAGEECWSDYRVKLESWHAQRDGLAERLLRWPSIQMHLQELVRKPSFLRRILEAVGSPLAFSRLTPPIDETQVRFAFLHAPLIRRRLTLGDLMLFFGMGREVLWRQLWSTWGVEQRTPLLEA